ncbi:MAG: lysophospholipid acyltransferase family protein [Anaerolineales bacterium]
MARNLYYSFVSTCISIYAKIMLRVDVQWQTTPPPGPRIFAANHPSGIDGFIIHAIIPGEVSTLITKSAFAIPLFGPLIRKTGQIPVVGLGEKAMEEALDVLQRGGTVAIFPEGTYSPREGGFRRPRTGVARLALMTGAPVIPLGIHVPQERILTIRSKIKGVKTEGYWYLYGPYHVTIGKPLYFDGDAGDMQRVRDVTQTVMHHIESLVAESRRRARKRRLVQAPA